MTVPTERPIAVRLPHGVYDRRRSAPATPPGAGLPDDGGVDADVAAAALDPIHRRADRWMATLIGLHALLALAIAPVYGTWRVTLAVTLLATMAFAVAWWRAPGRFVTRALAGLALQVFVALHIHQMSGLAEMHFFYFTSVSAMVLYKDWRALWPGIAFIIVQHTVFSVLHNAGIHPGGQRFFEPHHVSAGKLAWHFGAVLLQGAIASYAAEVLRRRTVREAQQHAVLLEQQGELEVIHRQLQEQHQELEVQAMSLAEQTALSHAAREAAEEANRAKGDFLAAMSHELRTPLNAIGGYTELLAMGIRGPVTEAQATDLARIQRSQRHLLGLISDILNFARLEAGQVELQVATVRVGELLASVEPLVAPQLAARSLAYACEVEAATPPLAMRADPDRVRQVLLNLVGNAVKFTDPGGSVRLEARALGRDWVELQVHDTGWGIPGHRLGAIFEPFVQVDRHRTGATQQGVGLGLAISRDLARAMGGDITVASVEGRGSTFTVRLPAAHSG